jgi:hypothetical protein
VFTFPNRKITLVNRKNTHRRGKPISTRDPSEKEQIGLKTEPLGDILDRFTERHRKDVEKVSKGYLSHGHANDAFKTAGEGQMEKTRFGRNREKQPEIGEMVDILGKFDAVNSEKRVMPNPESGPSQNRIHPKPKNNSKLISTTQFALTKGDHYQIVSKIDSKFIKPSMFLKHLDLGKKDVEREIRKYLEHELAVSNCPKTGPDATRLEIYSECFEKVIQEFTTFGPLLAEIKVETI